MADCMTFPKTAKEFIEQYKFTDTKQEYTNGAELIPVFRVKQMLEHYVAEGNHVPGKWIPVTERLPEAFLAVLAYCPNGGNIYEVYLNTRSEWHFFDETVAGAVLQAAVTHWMPLPQPPKGE